MPTKAFNINAPVVVEGTAGLTIVTNDGGTGGDLIFSGKGNVEFLGFEQQPDQWQQL